MAAVSSTVHHVANEPRVKIQDQSDDEPYSPNSPNPTSPDYHEEERDVDNKLHSSSFSIHNVLKKERDANSPDGNENVFSTDKLLQNPPNYEVNAKITEYEEHHSPTRSESPEPMSSPNRYEHNQSPDIENPSYIDPGSIRVDINVEDDVSCCSEDTVLSVGNEAPVSNINSSAESNTKSTPNSPGAPSQNLTSFKHIQTHLNAISQLSQNLNMNQPLLLRPNPITPNPLLFLNQPHLLFQNPLLNQVDNLKVGLNRTPNLSQGITPSANPFSSLNQFGMRHLKQNGISPNITQEPRNRSDENRRLNMSPKSDDESRRELILNQNCLKFSIDNILKADFGRRITDPLVKRKVSKARPSFEGPKVKENPKSVTQSDVRVPDVKGDKQAAIDLSKTDEGNNSSSSADGSMVWPAWVYCTRYSDRPSSGRSKYERSSQLHSPRTRRSKKPPGDNDEKRPRTAFSGPQLARLKHEFAENRYLTERRRQALAAELGLAEAQIKIWFQNKRAKIKKASGQRNPLALQLMAQGLYNHSTVPLTREEEELEMQAREREREKQSRL